MIHLFTIGFTEKSAEKFFSLLSDHKVNVLVDTRLKPDTQLSGFAKKRDLPFLLQAINHCDYRYMGAMAPTPALLDGYRKKPSWPDYEQGFRQLIQDRNLIAQLDKTWWTMHRACLLCSEHEPDHCHRRLVAEYIASYWPDIQITHLT